MSGWKNPGFGPRCQVIAGSRLLAAHRVRSRQDALALRWGSAAIREVVMRYLVQFHAVALFGGRLAGPTRACAA